MTAFQRFATPVTAVATATVCGALLAACGSDSSTAETTGTAAATTPSSTAAAQTATRAQLCGQTRGPDGALYVHALEGANVDCAEAMRVADAFSPKIATGKPTAVEGWNCTFPTSPGLLARCDSGAKGIGFFSGH